MQSLIRNILPAAACLCVLQASARAVDPAVLESQRQRISVIERIAPSVVAIFARGGQGGGSGVLISSDGYAVTNFHVVQGTGTFMKCGLNDGVVYDAVIVGIDPTGDVAIIKLLGRDDFPYSTLGDSDQVRVGDFAYAMGNPFLLAADLQPTVTYGMVSGVHRYQAPAGNNFLEYTDCIQVDTSINPGNSGGPLFNERGEIIGINGRISIEKRGRVNVGAGYAISSNQVGHFIDHLKSGRIVDHATLGATVGSNTAGAIVINGILEQSEAYRRGLRMGDEVVSFAGRPIRSVNQFKNVLGIYPRGWVLPLTYRRDGEQHDVYVRLRALHRQSELIPDSPETPRPELPPDGEPRPRPDGQEPPQPDAGSSGVPAEYAHMYVERQGFANYYFNELERDRVHRSLSELGDFGTPELLWTVTGRTDSGGEFQFKLSPETLAVRINDDVSLQPLAATFEDEPPGTGGLLVALHSLKMMLIEPGDYFSEFYYLGSEPLDGGAEMVDVLITTRSQVVNRWYFSRSDGRFLGFDTQLVEDVDACEVRIDTLRDFDGRPFPPMFSVRHGGRPWETFQVESLEIGAPIP